jgi:hypothetical protein
LNPGTFNQIPWYQFAINTKWTKNKRLEISSVLYFDFKLIISKKNIQGVVYQLQQKLHSECACAVPFVAECGLIHVCVLICVSTRKISRAAAAWSVCAFCKRASLVSIIAWPLGAQANEAFRNTHTTHHSDEDEPLLQMQMRSKLFSHYKSSQGCAQLFSRQFGDLSLIGLLVLKWRKRGSAKCCQLPGMIRLC